MVLPTSGQIYKCTSCGSVVPAEISSDSSYVPEIHVCIGCGLRGSCTKNGITFTGRVLLYIGHSIVLLLIFTLLSVVLPDW